MEPLDPGLRKLAQVAFVCRDIDATAQRWADLLGVPKPAILTTAPGSTCAMQVHGQPSDAQAKLAFFDLGGVQLELIQPLGGSSSWQEGLDRHGESFHHLGFWVENATQASARLNAAGHPDIHSGTFTGGGYIYHDASASLGATLELLYRTR